MVEVRTYATRSGREIAVLNSRGRFALGAASLPFIEWMSQKVPRRQLSTEQAALVQWFEKTRTAGELIG
jgi:hypothetical protein